jgi:SulP family sulfate permease
VGIIANAALAVALLSHLEVSLIGRPFSARAGDRFEANQYMFGLGMATFGNVFFSGMPASISLARSRLNWSHNPATPITGILAGVFCTVLFVGCAPLIGHIPRSVMAALAMVLATEIVSRHYVRVILKTSYADAWVFIVTVLSGLLFRLDVALYIGAGLSIVFFLRRVGVPELSEYEFTDEGKLAALKEKQVRPNPDISIVHVEGDLFFGAAEIFLEQARHMTDDPNLKVIILRMVNAHHLDATCALAIEEFLRFARDNDRHVIVSGAHRAIYRVFRNSGLLTTIGRENFFMDTPSNPTLSTRHALKRAQTLLGGADANIRIYVNPAKSGSGGGGA